MRCLRGRTVGGDVGFGEVEFRQYWGWAIRSVIKQDTVTFRARAREGCDFEGERGAVLAKAMSGVPAEVVRSLWRHGIPAMAPLLKKTMPLEALEHERRAGARLGIQRSIREAILASLGELQAGQSVAMPYLGNADSTASGGLYLPAMDALWVPLTRFR